MKHITSLTGEEFEVTEADVALVAPLGSESIDPSDRIPRLITALKGLLRDSPYDMLPHGYWDAYMDEGEYACGVTDCGDEQCGIYDHQIVTRPYSPEYDDVFVRMDMALFDDSLNVHTRVKNKDGHIAPYVDVAINGEPYTPEQCVQDLGVLLAIFDQYTRAGGL